MLKVTNLTMEYPNGKGVFDVSFEIERGQALGFLGPNGSGKTSTIRCLLGFLRGQKGECTIDGMESFANAPIITREVGFIAGEPAFPDGITANGYLDMLCEIRSNGDRARKGELAKKVTELATYFDIQPKGSVKRMSKGMKQKVAIIAAFLHDPKIYILDEPTSGLDPVMQAKFVDLLQTEKKRGKTILISSHMFEEVERVCDNVTIIREGRIVANDKVSILKSAQKKIFTVQSPEVKNLKNKFDINIVGDNMADVLVPAEKIDMFIKELAKLGNVTGLSSKEISLESVFMEVFK